MELDSIGANKSEKAAIHDFFIHTALPILIQEGEKFGIIATGTLFKIAGRSFLITAAHTMDSYPPENWAFPTHPRKGTIHTIGTAEYVKPSEPGLDVCIIELKDPEVIAILDAGWRFLTLKNVWLPDSADAILLAGYPSARTRFEDANLHGKIFIVRQKYRDGVPPEVEHSPDQLIKGVDFFIEYQDAVNEYTGESISSVHIGGMSGCSVWAYRQRGWDSCSSFWSAEVPLRVIGIQSAFVQNKYLRAKSWGGVLATLSLLDEEIQAEVRQFMERFIALTGYQPEQ